MDAHCSGCGTQVELAEVPLVGPDVPFEEAEIEMMCVRCGAAFLEVRLPMEDRRLDAA